MPRKKAAPDDHLEELITQYYNLDSQYKEIGNRKEPLNKAIKTGMRKRGVTEFRSGSLLAIYSVQIRPRYFDAAAVDKLKSLGFYQAVKEVVDPDCVKELIRSGQIAQDLLADYTELKEIEILSIKKTE